MKGDVPAYLYRDFPGKTLEQLYESIVPATGETNPNAEILNVIELVKIIIKLFIKLFISIIILIIY